MDSLQEFPAIGGGEDGAVHGASPEESVSRPRKNRSGSAAAARRAGHYRLETHVRNAGAATHSDDRYPADTQSRRVVADGASHCGHDTQSITARPVDPSLIDELRYRWRTRQSWHTAEKALTLRALAMCRGLALGDKVEARKILAAAFGEGGHPMAEAAFALTFPLIEARNGVEKHRLSEEKILRRLAKTLPVAPWVQAAPGASIASLAAIVGEAGDLSNYANPGKLWKRMGLAVMPDGRRQRRVADADEALRQGYSPKRRSVSWNVGSGLIGCMGKGPRPGVGEDVSERADLSPYQKLFIARLRYLAARDPAEFAREPVASKKTGEVRESFSAHAAAEAKRYVEKRFLRELWKEWRRAVFLVPAKQADFEMPAP